MRKKSQEYNNSGIIDGESSMSFYLNDPRVMSSGSKTGSHSKVTRGFQIQKLSVFYRDYTINYKI